MEAAVVRQLAPVLLEHGCPEPLQRAFLLWWRELPRQRLLALVPALLDALSGPRRGGKKANGVAAAAGTPLGTSGAGHDELLIAPLAVMSVSPSVWRRPLLVGCSGCGSGLVALKKKN
jgi:hypothetical protein